jgi:predicted nuclease of predicted toxin-antitoxin system
MHLLIDENVPTSVVDLFIARGHRVQLVRDVLPAGTPDPVVAKVGDQISAIVVTWDRGFDQLVSRVPIGGKAAFRRLGRISFSCDPVKARRLLEQWIETIEGHYSRRAEAGERMIVQVQGNALKLM